jgi:hypothetical protein
MKVVCASFSFPVQFGFEALKQSGPIGLRVEHAGRPKPGRQRRHGNHNDGKQNDLGFLCHRDRWFTLCDL